MKEIVVFNTLKEVYEFMKGLEKNGLGVNDYRAILDVMHQDGYTYYMLEIIRG